MIYVTDAIYLVLAALAAPLIAWRFWKTPRYRHALRERFGGVPPRTSRRPCLWIHGVSGGEIPAAKRLIELFRQRHPEWDVVLSVTTMAGRSRAASLFPDLPIFYYPVDFSGAINRTFRRIRPSGIVLLELEVWPNFIACAHRRKIPIVLLNGRFSKKGYWWHWRLRWIMGPIYRRLAAVGVQTELYARRIASLGVPRQRIGVTGTMKYDTVPLYGFDDRGADLQCALGLEGATVLVGGSTHGREEAALLDCFTACRQRHPALRLVLVPRRPERFDEVAALVTSRGFTLLRRTETASQNGPPPVRPDVVLIDTFGELERVYRLADVVFVGRSLEPRGGSNILEPAGCAKPVVFGPHMDNFADVAEGMLEAGGAVQVTGEEGLREEVERLLDNPEAARALGQRARAFVESRQGASRLSLAILEDALGIRTAEPQ